MTSVAVMPLPHSACWSCAATIWAVSDCVGISVIMTRRSAAKSRPSKSSKGSEKASSSGCNSPASTPRGGSPERVGKYDLSQLAKLWDDQESVRGRLREDHQLLLHFDQETKTAIDAHVEGNVANVKANLAVLLPLATLMAKNSLLMPCIDGLIQSVDQVYKIAKLPRNLEHCYQMGWAIRRLLVAGKNYCYKPSPPEAPRIHNNFCGVSPCARARLRG